MVVAGVERDERGEVFLLKGLDAVVLVQEFPRPRVHRESISVLAGYLVVGGDRVPVRVLGAFDGAKRGVNLAHPRGLDQILETGEVELLAIRVIDYSENHLIILVKVLELAVHHSVLPDVVNLCSSDVLVL